MPRPNAASYLMKQLNDQNDFTRSWMALSDDDKKVLRQWAEEEMDALGMEK